MRIFRLLANLLSVSEEVVITLCIFHKALDLMGKTTNSAHLLKHLNTTEKGVSIFWENSAPQSQLGVTSTLKSKEIHCGGSFLPGGEPRLGCGAAVWSSSCPGYCRQPVPSLASWMGAHASSQPACPCSHAPWISRSGLQQAMEQTLSNCRTVEPQQRQQACVFAPGEGEAQRVWKSSCNFRVWFGQFGINWSLWK